MHRTLRNLALLGLAFGSACAQTVDQRTAERGAAAMDYVRQVVELGPRPAGSEANKRQQRLILDELARLKCEVVEDDFTAQTPVGPLEMKNIIAKFHGQTERIHVVSGHYDTLARPELPNFVGANDGGSSTGLLLALAAELSGETLRDSIWIVFFDGEEATVAWQGDDHTYGSRRLARQWAAWPEKDRIRAIINVDMIGDADLRLVYEGNSTPWLRDLVWDTATRLGHSAHFPYGEGGYIEDDHVPFIEQGFAAVDLIDFQYGLRNRYWHTEQDTLEKLSPASLGIVLEVVRETLRELEKRP